MEGAPYVDIFATKGIEYLLAIGFLLALVAFWKLLNSSPRPAVARARSARQVIPRPASWSNWFRLPEEVFYHQGHTWAVPEGPDLVKVGVDDFAQHLLGEPSSVALPRVGGRVEQGNAGWQLGFDSQTIDLLSPVAGEVVDINEAVVGSPALVNQDPYGEGWLMKIRAPRLQAELRNLLSGRLARAWLEQTVDSLRRRTAGTAGVVLQDGGLPVAGIARNLSAENWHEIARDFLLTGDSQLGVRTDHADEKGVA